MSDQHSQGRMTVHSEGAAGWPLLMIGSRIVANVNPESGVDISKAPSIAFKKMPAEANARRMSACWNHCQSVSTEDLEAMDRPGDVSWAATIDRMVRERTELLATLQQIADLDSHTTEYSIDHGSNGVRDLYRRIARDAIAKATGSTT